MKSSKLSKTSFQKLVRKCEQGFSVTIQGIWYTYLLFFLLALVYDFGRVVYIHSIGYNAARAAAQEAGKYVDTNTWIKTQQIVLDETASEAAASAKFLDITHNQGAITKVEARPNGLKRYVIEVDADLHTHLPIMEAVFGMPPITLHIVAFAEPAYGIDAELQ